MCACVCVVGLLFVCSFSFFPSVSLLHVMYILSCFICTHVVCTCLILFILCHYFVSFTLLHCFINVCIRVCLCVCVQMRSCQAIAAYIDVLMEVL